MLPTSDRFVSGETEETACVSHREKDDYLKVEENSTEVVEMEYGFLVPYFNGDVYHGNVIRLTLAETHRTFVDKVTCKGMLPHSLWNVEATGGCVSSVASINDSHTSAPAALNKSSQSVECRGERETGLSVQSA